MFDEITASINQYARLSEAEIEDFLSRLQQLRFRKNEVLLKKGETCMAFCFVRNGSFRTYYLSENHEQVTLNLFTNNDWILDHKSFTAQKPSENFIEACEESEVFAITIHHLHDLIGKSQAYFGLGRILETGLNNYHMNKISPEDKYLALLKDRPDLLQKFPLKYIASYLGITPETLSRVRRKII